MKVCVCVYVCEGGREFEEGRKGEREGECVFAYECV